MTALDHGYLNLPLRNRGSINASISAATKAWALELKAARQAARRAARAQRKEARALVRLMTDFRLAELGKPYGLTIYQTRKKMLAAADARPAAVIASLTKEGAQ